MNKHMQRDIYDFNSYTACSPNCLGKVRLARLFYRGPVLKLRDCQVDKIVRTRSKGGITDDFVKL